MAEIAIEQKDYNQARKYLQDERDLNPINVTS